MKIALITDTHWGIRNDSQIMHDQMKRFLDEIFFPILDRENISTVIHLGDLVDRRKYINYMTAKRLRDDFLEPLKSKQITMHIIAGNHDTFYKNTNKINALKELVIDKYDNVQVYDDLPDERVFGSTTILMLPWICDENKEASMEVIRNSRSPIVMGHLELNGYEMYRGHVSDHGDDPKIFDKFDLVCSGHYHTRSSSGNIHYLGTPCQYNWSDYNDPKGFHILDTETRELTFIENPYNIYYKIFYDDLDKAYEEIVSVNVEPYKNCYVKMVVKNKTNPYWFDMVIDKIEKIGVADLQVVEDHLNLDMSEDADIVNEAEDTISIIKNYIGAMNLTNDRKRVENIIQSLYIEAHEIE
ncbi:SbcD DNA repair exonuclease [uncultured Caudovirales phage]|uniref:SbcD DNA repair exonuclease n=1 Tax=uncultured Caudovirales phage TaxID=2100421 RepID=A0A6J7WXH2_9CAUD|nr:SbcD DNA repair exonuclease [uncultured Caudovirales phage]